MSTFVNWNGKFVQENEVKISPNNHSFRYGDGCFETMKINNGQILLDRMHFQRLFSSLALLKFTVPSFLTDSFLSGLIGQLVHLNHHPAAARVRLVVYRGDGGLYDLDNNDPQFIIQSFSATHTADQINEKGLAVAFYNDAKKTTDQFSSIKSNNYLAYVMGALWAKENNLDDCIISNVFGRIADATIANIFIVSNGVIKTPAITEGCINGVMRRYILENLVKEKIDYMEAEITPQELLAASEVFLTNATYGICWVQKCGNSFYNNVTSSLLHQKFIFPLFNAATI